MKSQGASLIFCGLIILLGLVALWSLIRSPFYTSHDGFTHTARIAAYYQDLVIGQWPPRWANTYSGGLGSPIFVYSYPLPYFLGALFHGVKISYQDSFRLVMGLGYVLSGLAAYWWLSSRMGKTAGLVGAIFYLWAPYRFVNVYVRAALAENFAYLFVPLVLLGIDKIFEGKMKSRWWFLTIFSVAGLLLSHNVVAAMCLPIVGGLALLNFWLTRNVTALGKVLAALCLGFLMSSFIYLPDLFERSFVHFDEGISYWREHFVALWQLWHSHWGYGFDLPGTVNDDMSFQLGFGQIGVGALAGAVLVYQMVARRKWWRDKALAKAIFFLVATFGAILLMVENPIIVALWERLPGMKAIVDFPWRFLGISVVGFAYLAAYLVFRLRKRWVAATLVLAVLVANRNYTRVNQPLNYSDSAFDNYRGTSTAGSNEYNPLWHRSNNLPNSTDKVTMLTPGLFYQLINNSSRGLSFKVVGSGSGEARINRFYFPETEILVNDKSSQIDRGFEIISGRENAEYDDTGLIKILVKSGDLITLKFSETPLRKTADAVSLLSLGMMTVLGGWQINKKK